MHHIVRRASVLVAAAAIIGATTLPALGHAEISPTTVQPGDQVTLTVRSLVEREALINAKMAVLVPRQWQYLSCAAPTTWTCAADRRKHAPHTLVTYTPAPLATPLDIDFSFTVRAPRTITGTYLFRALQTHADGWVEPWVYETDPYPAPRVRVGTRMQLVNPDGSREDPRCFGPTRQPKDYASYDGKGSDAGACRMTAPRVPSAGAASPSRLLLLVGDLPV